MSTYKHKRTGRWIAQTWDAGLGRNVQVGSFPTQRQAREAVAAAARRQATSNMTVGEWRDVWLRTPGWKRQTRQHYAERTAHFAAAHGDRRLTAIDRKIARAWIADHPSHGHCLSSMFGAAAYEDNEQGGRLLESNPFAKLVRQKAAKRDLAADWLAEADIASLEATARVVHAAEVGHTLACMIRFAAETGVRPGELVVLEEADIDLDHVEVIDGVAVPSPRVWVRRAFESKTRTLGPPKNGRQRGVYLSAAAAAAAAAALRYEGAVTLAPGHTPQDEPVRGDEFWLPKSTPRLFSTRTGAQWRQPSLSTHWGPVRDAAGRPDMDFYELRHYCATRLLELGLRDDEVAVQLGHTDGGELVRRVYGHPNDRRALERVRVALEGAAA